jgi:putative CocE/NonD family hydrolase
VEISEAVTEAIVIDRDAAVRMRDGTVLRVNVFRPLGEGPFPVLMCAHPYGKDVMPRRGRAGRSWKIDKQFRLMRQAGPVRFSSLTTWEAPDPVWWTANGYVLINCDLRGAGTSGGVTGLFSVEEGDDYHDLIEWAGVQSWSNGAVGLLGVSYLALSQWSAAASRPTALKAICPWEGFTDAYRDLMCPGGIREDGFARIYAKLVRGVRQRYDLRTEQKAHPTRDAYWESLTPRLASIDVPALICGSFSDNNLHTRGSFRGFGSIASNERHLYTHRGGKWAIFYDRDARASQLSFFDRHLCDRAAPSLPVVRLEVREDRDTVTAIRHEQEWPLARTQWRPLHLTGDGLALESPPMDGSLSFDTRSRGVRFDYLLPEDMEITGPMALRLWVEAVACDDVHLFAGVEKWRGRRFVGFEGSYGFGRDRVTTGWQKASMRDLDTARSRPWEPVHTFSRIRPLEPSQVVEVHMSLGPSATLWRAGETLRLVIAGRWLWPRNPLTGQFPAWYQPGPRGRCVLHWGPREPTNLLIPVIDDPSQLPAPPGRPAGAAPHRGPAGWPTQQHDDRSLAHRVGDRRGSPSL